MDKVKRSTRLPIAVASAVQKEAEIRGISQYALLELCIHQGLADLSNETNSGKIISDIAIQIGTLASRVVHLEKLVERTLYVACAAYSYSRIATSSHKIDEAKINHEIQQAFIRQLNLTGNFDEQ